MQTTIKNNYFERRSNQTSRKLLLADIKTKWSSQLIYTESIVILHDSPIFFQWLIRNKIVLNLLRTGLVRVLPFFSCNTYNTKDLIILVFNKRERETQKSKLN